MARANTKIGDIFSVKLDENRRKYFQLIAFDLTQLNSDVIRVFNKVYSLDDNPSLLEVVSEEIDFYAHCVTKFGLKMNVWEKVGNIPEIGDTSHILFRDTNDYGNNVGGEEVKVSHNWHVWRINDENFTPVGRLEGENRHSYIGLVINPLGVIELLKGNKYPPNYPDYQ